MIGEKIQFIKNNFSYEYLNYKLNKKHIHFSINNVVNISSKWNS